MKLEKGQDILKGVYLGRQEANVESKGKRKKKEGRQQAGQEVRRQNESISGTARMSGELKKRG